MRFDLNDEQRAIQEAVRGVCRRLYEPVARPRDAARPDQFWTELAASGWTQLVAGDERARGGLVELSLVMEELGWALAPATFMGNAVAGLIISAAPAEHRGSRLSGIASGERRGAFGVLRRDGSGLAVDAGGAALLVLAGDGDARLLEPVPALEADEGIDITRCFARVQAGDGEHLTGGAIPAALDAADILLAAELVGVAQHALELAVDYARQRQQFGRPIGAYQAVSHRCADMLVHVESARSAVLSAAWTADHEPKRLAFAASTAKVAAATSGWAVATSALQVHGGIGFTWEHPIHRFVRRAAASSRLLRCVDQHLDRVAELSGLGAVEPARV